MANTSQMVTDLRNFLNKLKPLFEVVEQLESLGSLEQAAREATQRREQVIEETKTDQLKLDGLKNELKHEESVVGDKRNEAVGVERIAKDAAANLISKAKDSADEVIKKAQSIADVISEEAGKQRTLLKNMQSHIEVKKRELDDLKSAIEQTKAKISAL